MARAKLCKAQLCLAKRSSAVQLRSAAALSKKKSLATAVERDIFVGILQEIIANLRYQPHLKGDGKRIWIKMPRTYRKLGQR